MYLFTKRRFEKRLLEVSERFPVAAGSLPARGESSSSINSDVSISITHKRDCCCAHILMLFIIYDAHFNPKYLRIFVATILISGTISSYLNFLNVLKSTIPYNDIILIFSFLRIIPTCIRHYKTII